MKCSKCNCELTNNSLVCSNCGNINFFEFTEEITPEETTSVEENVMNDNNDLVESTNIIEPVEEISNSIVENQTTLEEPINEVEETNKDYTPNELMDEISNLIEETIDEDIKEKLENEEISIEEPIIEEQPINNFEPIEEINNSIEDITVKPTENNLKGTGFLEDYMHQKMEDRFKDKYKEVKIPSRVLLIALFLIIIVISLITIYIGFMSPKAIYKKLQNQIYDIIDKNVDSDIETMSGILNGSFMVSNTMKDKPINWQFDTQYGIDYQNRILNLTFKTNQNYQELSNINYYLQNGYSYINVGNNLNQYVSNPYEEFNQLFSSKNDIEILNKCFNNAFRKTIKNKHISQSRATIKRDFQDELVVDTLTLKIDEFVDELLTSLSEDNDFINTYSRFKNISPNEVESLIQAEIAKEKNITFELYTHGLLKDIVGYKVSSKDNYSLEVIRVSEQRYSFVYDSNNLEEKITGTLVYNEMNDWLDVKLEASNQKNIEILADFSFKNEYNEPVELININNVVKEIELPNDKLQIYNNELEKNKSIFNYDYNKQILN